MTEAPRSTAPTMGLAQAAKACNVSVSTLRRRKEILLQAGATITEKGWQIPIPALVSLGVLASTTAPPEASPEAAVEPPTTPPSETPGSQALAVVETLRSKLAEAEMRAQVAEAIAAERERIIETQAMALRMLEGGTVGTHSTVPPVQVPDTPASTGGTASELPPASGPQRPSAGRLRRFLSFRSPR